MLRGFKGLWVPKEIWEDKALSWQEKLLVATVLYMDCGCGCTSTNRELAEFFGLSTSSISKLISSTQNKGFIDVRIYYNERGTNRVIYPTV